MVFQLRHVERTRQSRAMYLPCAERSKQALTTTAGVAYIRVVIFY